MKHFNLVLGSLIALLFMSCTGPQGPQGFDGFDGLDGQDGEPGIQAQIFEVEGLNLSYFDADNVWETVLTFEDFTR